MNFFRARYSAVILSAAAGVAALALASAGPSYATTPVSAGPSAAGLGCRVPLPPATKSGSKPGWWFNKRSPLGVALYYLSAVSARHYRIQEGGFGGNFGPNGGSGFGFRAHSSRCGYFAVGGGGNHGHGTQFEVCVGKTAASVNRCVGSNNSSRPNGGLG
jgi:hypothetical protein